VRALLPFSPCDLATAARMMRLTPRTLQRRLAGGRQSPIQHPQSPLCMGGHFVSPYEQKTQQSPRFGRSNERQPGHSKK
jgi:hypothetical protein